MSHKFAVAAAAVLLTASFSAPALAQPAPVQSGTYKVEASHTRVLFAVSHMGFSTWYGDFTGASGSLKLDGANPANSSIEISVPTASVSTTNTVLDGELKAADWFDAAKYPTISFKSRQVTVTAPGEADVAGDLTLHGVTKPVEADCVATGIGDGPAGKKAGFECNLTIKRSEWGMKWGVEKPAKALGDEVKLVIALEGDVAAPKE